MHIQKINENFNLKQKINLTITGKTSDETQKKSALFVNNSHNLIKNVITEITYKNIGWTHFHDCAFNNRLTNTRIQEFIKKFGTIDVKNDFGNTPFLIAAHQFNINSMKLLQKNGANVHMLNIYNMNALNIIGENSSIRSGYIEVMKYLLHLGINPKNIDTNINTLYTYLNENPFETIGLNETYDKLQREKEDALYILKNIKIDI